MQSFPFSSCFTFPSTANEVKLLFPIDDGLRQKAGEHLLLLRYNPRLVILIRLDSEIGKERKREKGFDPSLPP